MDTDTERLAVCVTSLSVAKMLQRSTSAYGEGLAREEGTYARNTNGLNKDIACVYCKEEGTSEGWFEG